MSIKMLINEDNISTVVSLEYANSLLFTGRLIVAKFIKRKYVLGDLIIHFLCKFATITVMLKQL